MDVLVEKLDKRKLKETIASNLRIKAYCGIILVCSCISLSEDYKIDKRNPLNQWFVKLGWFWTTALTLPFLFIGLRNNDRDGVAKALLRTTLSTFIWFFSVNVFQFFDTNTGFDISGHTFLLIFSNLMISSEIRLSDESMSEESKENRDSDTLDSSHRSTMKLSLQILSVLWDFMLLQTALYYHTILQKLIAVIWAIGSWYILHILFYDKSLEARSSAKMSGSRQ